MFGARLCLAAALTAAVCVSGPVAAQSRLGVLQSLLPPDSSEDVWSFANDGKTFVMINGSDDSSIRYFQGSMSNEGTPIGPYRITADVTVTPAEGAEALGGLIYGRNNDDGRYFLAVHDGTKALTVLLRGENGLRRIDEIIAPELFFEGPNRIEIVATGEDFTFYFNGTEILTHANVAIPGGTDTATTGGFGIVAIGRVIADFSNIFLIQ